MPVKMDENPKVETKMKVKTEGWATAKKPDGKWEAVAHKAAPTGPKGSMKLPKTLADGRTWGNWHHNKAMVDALVTKMNARGTSLLGKSKGDS